MDSPPKIELITTGTELVLGRVLNTHQQWISRQLADRGWLVARQMTVPDTAAGIEEAVRDALGRADLVITTGGLGPTSDDLTRDLVAGLLGKPLHEDPAIVAHIRAFFHQRNRPMPEHTKVQALVPEGAKVLANPFGTAPGLAMEVRPNPFRKGSDQADRTDQSDQAWLIMLPGPPRELRPMFMETVLPLLEKALPARSGLVCRTLRTTGIGESMVQERICAPLQSLVDRGLEIGYCAFPGQVDVRLAAQSAGAAEVVQAAEQIVREQLGPDIYSAGDEDLETVVIRLLTERKETLAVAESCTGGRIADRLTNVPGASAALLAGLVTYSNGAKQSLLGVAAAIIERHGAVSEPTARQMAEGARARTGATYALSVTGIAGPSGGTPQKPVGTVFIGLARPSQTVALQNSNPFDRETFKEVTAQQALDLLRRTILTANLIHHP